MAETTAMDNLQQALAQVNKMPGLSAMVDHVDNIIEMLTAARNQVAES